MNLLSKTILAITAIAFITPAFANDFDHDHRDKRHHHQEPWHDHDIHRFHEHDLGVWRSGNWIHARHQGRLTWWWVAGGIWYPYQAQVLPYPDPYMPPETVYSEQQPMTASPSTPSEPNQFWYYCSQPQGYYPYTAECQVPWQKVPANPPPDMPR